MSYRGLHRFRAAVGTPYRRNGCDICQMLAFIGACKDAEYSSLQSRRENQRRVASKQVKNNISRGALLALEPYIVMIDELWAEKTSPQNTTERWTQEAVLEEIGKEHSQKIKAVSFRVTLF